MINIDKHCRTVWTLKGPFTRCGSDCVVWGSKWIESFTLYSCGSIATQNRFRTRSVKHWQRHHIDLKLKAAAAAPYEKFKLVAAKNRSHCRALWTSLKSLNRRTRLTLSSVTTVKKEIHHEWNEICCLSKHVTSYIHVWMASVGQFLKVQPTFFTSRIQNGLRTRFLDQVTDFVAIYYRPQRSYKGYVFTPVCDSVHRGPGVCLSLPLRPGTPPEETPPGTRSPSRQLLLWTVRILLECILVYN